MNNIGLIISGNLTGFSHFYDSPVAKSFCVQTKFDFDYRNYITFLSTGDKLYVTSFAPTVLAISLVTRILDSYRRPGILVISILIPRHKKIESVATGQSDRAVYDLLNAINDKFYERNFINGMLNQNPAVLMQDYYSDIMAGYRLVDDPMQRNVCMTVDPTLANKRSGYVKAVENDIASYLATPCRKSYEGYNDVFFAANAPQNIDEPPVEVVLYNVRITNNGQRIPGVRLADRVFDLRPGEGETDINKNYTYQQVLNGEAGSDIVATVVGESLEVTYRFKQEERTINFQFSDGANVLPFEKVMPIIVMNGTELNLPSESYTFRGKEIYGVKQLKSSNPNLAFKQPNLDISRIQDGGKCIILVEQSTPISFEFQAPYNKPKTITLRRNNGVVRTFNVTSLLNESLPGRCEEYSYTITSDYYETVSGQMEQFLRDRHVNLVVKKPQAGPASQKSQKEIANSLFGNKPTVNKPQEKPHFSTQKKQASTEVTAVVTSQKGDWDFKLNSSPDPNNKPKKKSKRTIIIGAIAVVAVALLGVIGFVFKDQLLGDGTEQEEVYTEVTKTVTFIIEDNSQNDKDLTEDAYNKIEGSLYVEYEIDDKKGIATGSTCEFDGKKIVCFVANITCDSTNNDSLKYSAVWKKDGKVEERWYPNESMSQPFNELENKAMLTITINRPFSKLKGSNSAEQGQPKVEKKEEPVTPQTENKKEKKKDEPSWMKEHVTLVNEEGKAVLIPGRRNDNEQENVREAYNNRVKKSKDNGAALGTDIKKEKITTWGALKAYLGL